MRLPDLKQAASNTLFSTFQTTCIQARQGIAAQAAALLPTA